MFTRQDEGSAASGREPVVAEALFDTPWGQGLVTVWRGRLAGVELPPLGRPAGGRAMCARPHEDHKSLDRWVAELEGYFRGTKLSWDAQEAELDLDGMAPFARQVVKALLTVTPGATISYGELAEMAGHPRAARAVGTVMARNPIPIVVPCHRVIRSDGSLGRYGTDASWKERLLDHERRIVEAG